jgi:fructose-1,6-bisphosphatase/inositol monophosphatase family enzyme
MNEDITNKNEAYIKESMLDVAIHTAKEAGALVKRGFDSDATLNSNFKQENDTLQVVTDYDGAAEKLILDKLKAAFPDHAFFSEEVGDDQVTSDFRWIIDPIDGTSNYARQIPFFCVSIGLTYKNEPIIGVVYQPVTDELFSAEKGKGAFLNGKKIEVSSTNEINKAFITVDRGKSQYEKERFANIVTELTKHVRSMRMPGSGALQACYVACGRFDAAIFNGLSFYDVAAAAVIAQEAGAHISNFSGQAWELKTGDMLISHMSLQSKLTTILQSL